MAARLRGARKNGAARMAGAHEQNAQSARRARVRRAVGARDRRRPAERDPFKDTSRRRRRRAAAAASKPVLAETFKTTLRNSSNAAARRSRFRRRLRLAVVRGGRARGRHGGCRRRGGATRGRPVAGGRGRRRGGYSLGRARTARISPRDDDARALRAGQDAWVLEKAGAGGYFVEAGAHDGVSHSNTVALERHHGWRGLCVEANAKLRALVTRRRSCAISGAALAGDDGRAEILFVCPDFATYFKRTAPASPARQK